jgi:hypothetical protein
MISPRSLLVVCFIATACISSYTPSSNSRADLQQYVERAAALVREQGPAACETLKGPAWMRGDYYIFVNTLDEDVTVCHPLRPELIGQSQTDIQDANGKYFAREMRAAASSPAGFGWVEYVWPRPGQTAPVPKSTYVMTVTGPDGKRYVVGSGGYEVR